MEVALLAGGTGGAKLAVGLRDVLHGAPGLLPETDGRLSVIANTADDIEIYGVHVSPDPDLITFRLAGVIGEAGFGIAGESHRLMDARRAAGEDVWFELGDQDMALCAVRAEQMQAGASLTEAHARATAEYDTGGPLVLPMSDQPVRTIVRTAEGEVGIQQYLIKQRSEPEILDCRYEGIDRARLSPAAADAIANADLIVVGPSNPAISIAPIIALSGAAAALREARAPVLGVSPLVDGRVLKGPTAKFLESAGHRASCSGAASYLAERFPGVIDAWIADEPVFGLPHHLAAVDLSSPEQARAVASEVLLYGSSLASLEAA